MAARYGSDLIVDLLKVLGIEYVALNPGSSFRGLHDSLVIGRDDYPACRLRPLRALIHPLNHRLSR